MDISVVIPLYNEDESLPELYDWIERVMTANNFSFEVIFVNDGSTDRSWDVITELAARSEHVKGIKFLSELRPIDFALNMLTINIITGFFLGVPIAAVMQRAKN